MCLEMILMLMRNKRLCFRRVEGMRQKDKRISYSRMPPTDRRGGMVRVRVYDVAVVSVIMSQTNGYEGCCWI